MDQPWLIFIVFASALFALDLALTARRTGPMGFRTSFRLTGFWVAMALLFNAYVFWHYARLHGLDPAQFPATGLDKAVEFLTGYLVEQSLSIDNLFVFLAIFGFMRLTPDQQPTALKWGIFGAILLRILFVLAGVALIQRFHWIIYVFGAIILWAAWKLAFGGDENVHPEKNILYRLASRFMPIDAGYAGRAFFHRKGGRLHMTPLFLTVLLILSTDIVFAVDSIPAILAITQDRFIVISSNVFAVLGLQAMFFAFSKMASYFHYLKHGVALVLAFIGVKMLTADFFHIPPMVSLGVVVGIIAAAVAFSAWKRPAKSP